MPTLTTNSFSNSILNSIFRQSGLALGFMLLFVFAGSVMAQNQYVVLVPDKYYSLEAKKGESKLNIKKLLEEIAKYKNLASSIKCVQQLNPLFEEQIRIEMKRIVKETPYILAVNWDACKFLSLRVDSDPEKRHGSLSDPMTTLYRFTLYPEIPLEPIINAPSGSKSQRFLLATFKDENGQWIAMGPYLTTDGFASEEQAIGSLFYSDDDLEFLAERGKFRIYALKNGVDHNARDIRFALEQLGVTDIPE